MKKSYPVLIILIIFVIFFAIYFLNMQSQSISPETTLSKAFNNSGARVVSTEIYFWGRVDDANVDNIEKLKELALDFSRELGLTGDNMFTKKTANNDFIDEVEFNGNLDGNRSVNISVQLRKQIEGEPERFISVNVIEELSNQKLEETKENVLAVFEKYKIKPKVNSCITGSFNGKMGYEQLNDMSKLIFKGAEAEKVEGMRDGNLISVSAYSPKIGSYIEANGSRVNLNLAIRYNSYEDKTYIWLATPVITTEY